MPSKKLCAYCNGITYRLGGVCFFCSRQICYFYYVRKKNNK